MCGIAGFLGQGNKEDLEKMLQAVRHRGPDDQGVMWQSGVGLAHARLSIIDTSSWGHQPMSDQDQKIHIVFNGEIYNFQNLRRELEPEYKFKTETDTEVIIAAYLKYSEKAFEKLDGMFALAIYDSRDNKLILGRDRLGKKPLYWSVVGESLIFGSELKALMAYSGFNKKLSSKSIDKYLALEYVPTPHTILEGAYKLEPATYLIWQNGSARKETFWQPKFETLNISFPEAVDQLDGLMDDAVKKRLMSDVPLGVFLSGGIDSSTIAYYAQQNLNRQLKTFSIAFNEKSYDESSYATRVATHLGTDHHTALVTAQDAYNLVPRLGELMDEPLADASFIPTYLLSQKAKQFLTVALSGDGGDELFFGYPTFQAEKIAGLYQAIPTQVRSNLIEPLINRLPTSLSYLSLDFKLKKFIDGFNGEPKYRHQRWLGSFIKSDQEYEDTDRYYYQSIRALPANQLSYVYVRTYLMDDVLVKVDRASMASAVEVRAPLLDQYLVDFALSLPPDYKQKGFTTKYILKKLMQKRLPAGIANRRKQGFALPLSQWLKNELKPLCEAILSRDTINQLGLNYEMVEELKNNHFQGRKNNRKQLWTLMVLGLWINKNL